jgi:uncharacterized protein (DUF488 family)
MPENLTVWTIGHGTAELDELFRALSAHSIEVLVDVRTNPYSRYVAQANRETLAAAAAQRGLRYAFMGDELGGQPADPAHHLPNGKPDYAKMEASTAYGRGISRLLALATTQRVCCLCSEEDPARCHRGLLIAETLVRGGRTVLHLRHNGTVETHAEMTHRRTGGQLALF